MFTLNIGILSYDYIAILLYYYLKKVLYYYLNIGILSYNYIAILLYYYLKKVLYHYMIVRVCLWLSVGLAGATSSLNIRSRGCIHLQVATTCCSQLNINALQNAGESIELCKMQEKA